MQTERLALRVHEAADALGVSRAKAYQLISSGTLPSIKVGASIRVPVDALRDFISRQMTETREAGRG